MAGEHHCSMDDDPLTDEICHLLLRTRPRRIGRRQRRGVSEKRSMERLADLSDGQTMLCVAGDFNRSINQ